MFLNLWDTENPVLSEKFRGIQAYLKKQKKSQVNNLTTFKGSRKGRTNKAQSLEGRK